MLHNQISLEAHNANDNKNYTVKFISSYTSILLSNNNCTVMKNAQKDKFWHIL